MATGALIDALAHWYYRAQYRGRMHPMEQQHGLGRSTRDSLLHRPNPSSHRSRHRTISGGAGVQGRQRLRLRTRTPSLEQPPSPGPLSSLSTRAFPSPALSNVQEEDPNSPHEEPPDVLPLSASDEMMPAAQQELQSLMLPDENEGDQEDLLDVAISYPPIPSHSIRGRHPSTVGGIAPGLLCSVCFHNPVHVVLIPCGHISTCSECLCVLRDQAQGQRLPLGCPFCRQQVSGIYPFYICCGGTA